MQFFEMVTALTVSGIVAILVLYIIIVYKKGWLRQESKADQAYYLCPNQKCKKVFNKPVWLTDLSKTPPSSYQACPHCGMNIQTTASPSLTPSPISDGTPKPLPSPIEVRGRQNRPHFNKNATASEKAQLGRELQYQSPQTSGPTNPPKSEDSQVPKPILHFPKIRRDKSEEPSEMPKKVSGKGSSESAKKCSHFFGYVRTLPKNTPIPDECLWCPSIVDCLTQEHKVEA